MLDVMVLDKEHALCMCGERPVLELRESVMMKILRWKLPVLLTLLFGSPQGAVGVPQEERLAVAGRLDIDLHAEFMVARNEWGVALNWYNCGYSGGTFGNFGLDAPTEIRRSVERIGEVYPRWLPVDGSPALFFRGDHHMKADFASEPGVTGREDFTIEVWIKNSEARAGEGLLGWVNEGATTSAPFVLRSFLPAVPGWQHIAVVATDARERWYADGVRVADQPREMFIGEGHRLVLGGVSPAAPSYRGFLAAVRVHSEAMTEEQIRHNVAGGPMLGTRLWPNLCPDIHDQATWGDDEPETYALYTTERFRTRWLKALDEDGAVAARVPHQLAMAERLYDLYAHKLALRVPIVSARAELRGDGMKYKIHIANNWDGGNWMGWYGEKGFGYPIQGPGHINPHEFVHGCQGHMEGRLTGNWWEAHANFPQVYAGVYQTLPGLNNTTSMMFQGHGRHYYHSRLMFEHLSETPEYGYLFVSKLWHEARGETYPWTIFSRIDPYPEVPMSDEWNRMARRNVTWDYENHLAYRGENGHPDMQRRGRTVLEPVPHDPEWWRVPKQMAPQQFGWNIIPLQPQGHEVAALLEGYVNAERGSDWRASFVAVNTLGLPRYSPVFKPGERTEFALREDEPTLFLVVSATPSNVIDIEMTGDYRANEQHQFPYKVKLEGCAMVHPLAPPAPRVAGAPHANGGGFVAATARADDTAYVAPGAQVLGASRVLGHARVEGHAVVENATVQDHAVVSDFARVEGQSVIRDHAKVRDYALVRGRSTVRDYARILEHAQLGGGKLLADRVTVKGMAAVSGNARGTAMIDGTYAKSNEITRGKWFTWSWAQGQNPGEIDEDFGGLYLRYSFEEVHPYLAWDDHGVTWGYLHGGPEVKAGEGREGNALVLDGRDQFVELPRDVADHRDITLRLEVNWDGGPDERILEFAGEDGDALYMTPSDGQERFVFALRKGGAEQRLTAPALPRGEWVQIEVIIADGVGRLFIDGSEADRSDRFTLRADDVGATRCYLGRGADGGFLTGMLDEVEIFKAATKDDHPPSPDPAMFGVPPTFARPGLLVMESVEGRHPRGGVQYRFEETGGTELNSGWLETPVYRATDLDPGLETTWRVRMRDRQGNETAWSDPATVRWEAPMAYRAEEETGLIVIDAAGYSARTDGLVDRQWVLTDEVAGYTGEGTMRAEPYASLFIDGNVTTDSPRLDYDILFPEAGAYWVWVRALGRDHGSIHLGLNLALEPWGREMYVGTHVLQWRRHHTPIRIDEPGLNRLSVWMRKDGVALDRIVLTRDGDYAPWDRRDQHNNMLGAGPQATPRSVVGDPGSND